MVVESILPNQIKCLYHSFSEDNVLSDEIKIKNYAIFLNIMKVTKIERSAFLDTRTGYSYVTYYCYVHAYYLQILQSFLNGCIFVYVYWVNKRRVHPDTSTFQFLMTKPATVSVMINRSWQVFSVSFILQEILCTSSSSSITEWVGRSTATPAGHGFEAQPGGEQQAWLPRPPLRQHPRGVWLDRRALQPGRSQP